MLNFPRWKVILIFGVIIFGLLASLPNFLSEEQRAELPGFLPSKTLNLGLDLRGGVNLLWGAQTQDVVNTRLSNIADQVRDIRKTEKGLNFKNIKITSDAVTFEVTRDEMIPLAKEKLTPVTQNSSLGVPGFMGASEPEVEMSNEGARFSISLTEHGIAVQKRDAIERAMEVIRKRVDPDGTKEITLQPQGGDRIILEVPGAGDPEEIKRLIGKTAKLSFHDVDTNISQEDMAKGRLRSYETALPLKDGGMMVIKNRVIVSGDDLINAKATFDQNGKPAVSFQFNNRGAIKFARHTRENLKRPFAIVLDDQIISAPVIQSVIPTGDGQITNIGTAEEAQELATLLKAGALPVKLTVLSERTVGPDLGADSIEAGELAAFVGFTLVVLYMAASYGLFGLAANVALITNVVLIMGALSLLQATLTLPGIAGIVLTIGMAVDANVLIFERIGEEQRAGKKPFQALEQGYAQAFSTIIDANITTFIAAAVLYMLGSGPVQGFAVTLAIGIITSMFTAIVLTRYILSVWIKRKRPAKLAI